MIICSATTGTCLPPFRLDNFYKDGYDCMLDGYKMSLQKTEEIGREEINKHKIYINFGCNEDHSNKTPASYIIIK
jgi:hypothetical protein